MREIKLLSYPMRLAVAYLLLTIALFLFGPIQWNIPSYPKVVIVLLVYVFSFALGYHVQLKQRLARISPEELKLRSDPNRPGFGFLGETPVRYVTLVFAVSCIFSIIRCIILLKTYYGGVNFSTLFNLDLSQAYMDRLGTEAQGTWHVLLLNMLSALDVFWYVLGILYFKRLRGIYKCLFFVTLAFNILYTAAGGTMIAWGVFVFKLIPFLLIFWYRAWYGADLARRRKNRYFILIILVLCILFVLFFSSVQEARYEAMGYGELTYETGDMEYFIEDVDRWPLIHSVIYPVTFYLTHGYCGFAHALEIPAEFTYGLGFSRDMAAMINVYFGLDVSEKVYPQRLENMTGWTNGMYWPSAYTWFASDLTFWGIPVLMFIFGWFLCKVWYSALHENSMIAVALSCWLWTGILFIPANNQLFQSLSMFMTTVALIVLYAIRKHLPLIVFRRDDAWRQRRGIRRMK